MRPVPCPACAEPMDVKPDVKGRPYGACYPCGAQLFVKGARGLVEFEKRYGKDWKAGQPNAPGEASRTNTEPPAATPPARPAPAKPSKKQPAPAATPAPAPEPQPEKKRESILDKPIL